MERKNVKSSNIKSIGYDVKSMRLEIEFRSGGVFVYDNVPESMYKELMDSASVGKYFHANIKNNFTHHRVN